MTGSRVHTALGGGLVTCAALLTTVGGLFATTAGAEPDPAAPPAQTAGPGVDTGPDGQTPQEDSPPAPDTADDSAIDTPTGGPDSKHEPRADTAADSDPEPPSGRPGRGWHPRTSRDAGDPESQPQEPREQPEKPRREPGRDLQQAEPAAAPGERTAAAPDPVPGIAAAAQHLDPVPDPDDDDHCGWPPKDPFWSWLISLFTPKPGTGTGSVGGSGGGGPSVPAAQIPGSADWPSAPTRLPSEGVDAPELGRVGADVEPPAAAPPPVAVPIPAPIVVLPPVVAHPHPSGPAIAVPAKPNSTETQHPPARPELPGKSPAAPGLAPDGFRAGYATYLQSASIGEVAGLAGLGVSGLAALTAVGGLIGFRQAKAGLAVKAVGTARFLQ